MGTHQGGTMGTHQGGTMGMHHGGAMVTHQRARQRILYCDRLLKVFCRGREFSVATEIVRPRVATEILCRNRAWGPGECDCAFSTSDSVHNAHAAVHATNQRQCTVPCTVLGYCSWALFKKKNDPAIAISTPLTLVEPFYTV